MKSSNLDYLQKMDKKALSVTSLDSKDTDTAFWLSKPPVERLIALELLRQRFYNYETATARLQRVLEFAEQA
jgi:hypothetical protein